MNISLQQQSQEASILHRIAGNDKQAVEDCLNKYGNLVWSLALNFTNSREDAEDAVQDIFIDVWKYAGRFDETKSAEVSFVSLIARRRLIDLLRRQKRKPEIYVSEETLQSSSNGYDANIQNQIEAKQAIQYLNKLNPQQRKLVQMTIYGGMSQSEIAETTGLPLGTVKSHIRRGFQKIRDSFPSAPDKTFAAAG